MHDNRGLETTVASHKALGHFETSLSQMLTHEGEPVDTIESALVEDPEFILAHCLRAHAGGVMTDATYRRQVRESVETAESLFHRANERERGHILAARCWLDGRFDQASEILGNVLMDHPRDMLALQVAHLFDFYRGDAANLKVRVERVLPHLSQDCPTYGYALGMYAFGLEECNDYALAEQTGQMAVDINPADVWAIHAVAHVLEMQGRKEEGIEWYRSRIGSWVGKGLAIHNWWHLALFHLDLGQYDQVLSIYDEQICNGSVTLELLDASSLLWRLNLLDIETTDRWNSLSRKWIDTTTLDGYYCFNDVHGVMTFVGSGQFDMASDIIEQLKKVALKDNDSGRMIRRVGLPASEALLAFGTGDYVGCRDLLREVLPVSHEFGGSHAQRDVLVRTLHESGIRSGDPEPAGTVGAEQHTRYRVDSC